MDGLKQSGALLDLQYEEDGIRVRAVLDEENFGRLKAWIPGFEEPKEDWDQ